MVPLRSRRLTAALTIAMAVSSLALASCGGDMATGGRSAGKSPSTTGGVGGEPAAPETAGTDTAVYRPAIDPAYFVERIDNRYLPLTPGARWVYVGIVDGELERTEVLFTPERRKVTGISAVVVRDTVTVDGELVEDTFDRYTQDRHGDVWYLGEDTKEYEAGKVVSTEGSWEAAVDGALPGIVMPATPTVGRAYRQEYYPGKAEDMAEIVRLDATATVPLGKLDGLVVTREWNPLAPGPVEEKHYAPGLGLVLEVAVAGGNNRVELVEFTPSVTSGSAPLADHH